MKRRESQPARAAQELAYDAMDADDDETASRLCRQALEIYPNCADALNLLADIECELLRDYVDGKRRAVEAGRRDLGDDYFKQMKGSFWREFDTRPYMRAMAGLADALQQWGQPEHIEEAIDIYERMLELNPHDNQGVRDPLAGCYLRRRRYDDAARLLKRYKGDWTAVPLWAQLLLSLVIDDEKKAARLLQVARKQ